MDASVENSGGAAGRGSPLRRWARPASWVVLASAVIDWLGLRAGWWAHAPELLLGLVAVAGSLLLLHGVMLSARLVQGRGRAPAAAELALIAGLLTLLGGGGANWLLGYSGFVILQEGEGVPLEDGRHLQEFHAGPFARTSELAVVMTLASLELVPLPGGGFAPRSRVIVERPGREAEAAGVDLRSVGIAGPLRLHQGAFGFAPRIVLLHGDRTVFDRVVPFTTVRSEGRSVRFEGDFAIAAEEIAVDGALDLASLDEGMRGHATLHLDVTRRGAPLGRGQLLPGHFAQIEDGWHVGFAGLQRWSEIDVSRRNYSRLVLAGAVLASIGALAWPLAARSAR